MTEVARSILARLREYTDPTLATTYATHRLHPYPAKFIPQIAADIIQEHTNERHVVFDPFCGSGTTLVEALLHSRRSIGCDNNPIAALVSRAKTTPLSATAGRGRTGGQWFFPVHQVGIFRTFLPPLGGRGDRPEGLVSLRKLSPKAAARSTPLGLAA
jgi:hypothetical protein